MAVRRTADYSAVEEMVGKRVLTRWKEGWRRETAARGRGVAAGTGCVRVRSSAYCGDGRRAWYAISSREVTVDTSVT